MMVRRSYWILLISLAVLSVAVSGCITQSAAEPSDPTADVMPAPTDSATAPLQPTTAVGGAACPQPSEGQLAYINEAGGFCFLYPASLEVVPEGGGSFGPQSDGLHIDLVGPPLDPNAMETAAVSIGVNVIAAPGAATTVTAADYAQEVIARDPTAPVQREDTTIAGQPAVMINQMPGLGVYRVAYLVVDSTLYELRVLPDPSVETVLRADAQAAWDLVTGSLVFFSPSWTGDFTSPEEVCPQPTEGFQLYVNRPDGYCLLYPTSFQPDSEWPAGFFVGGPEITAYPEFPGASRVRLAIGAPGPAGDEALDQIVDRHLINSVEGQYTREAATVGGFPTVVIKDMSPPVPEWTAYVNANGHFYTILVSPTDFTALPEVQQPVEEIWNSALSTMQFFTPWR